jgi:hypothetical protein
VNENLRRAVEALESGVADVRDLSVHSIARARERLRRALDDAETHLARDENDSEPEDVIGRLDRQSREIADELRRVERLMRERTGRGE